jgi:hypothetical protein
MTSQTPKTLRQAAVELLQELGPTHYGHWLLSQKYELIEDGPDGNVALTDRGRDFIEHEGGEVEVFLDEQEGLSKVLALVADTGPPRAGGILEEWTEYLNRHSSVGNLCVRLRCRVPRYMGLASDSDWDR